MGLVLDVGRSNAPDAGQVIRHREVVPIGNRFLARGARINCYPQLVDAADQIKLVETTCDCLSRNTSRSIDDRRPVGRPRCIKGTNDGMATKISKTLAWRRSHEHRTLASARLRCCQRRRSVRCCDANLVPDLMRVANRLQRKLWSKLRGLRSTIAIPTRSMSARCGNLRAAKAANEAASAPPVIRPTMIGRVRARLSQRKST